jgi:hypothetical protein
MIVRFHNNSIYQMLWICVIKWDKEWWHSKWLLPISSNYSAIHLKNHQKIVTVNHCPSSAWNWVPPQIYARHQAYHTDVRNKLCVCITEGQEIYGFNLKIGYFSYQVHNLCYFQMLWILMSREPVWGPLFYVSHVIW